MLRKRRDVIEGSSFEVREAWYRLGNEVALMESKGHSLEEREDHVFRTLRKLEVRSLNEADGGLGISSLFQGVKRAFAEEILNVFQVQPGFLRDVIANFIANLGIQDLRAFVSPGGCQPIVAKLGGAIQGAIVDYILKSTGLAPNNFLTVSIVEAFKSAFAMGGPFVKMASETICKIKLSELLPGGGGLSRIFGGGQAAPAADGTAAVATPAAQAGAPGMTPAQ